MKNKESDVKHGHNSWPSKGSGVLDNDAILLCQAHNDRHDHKTHKSYSVFRQPPHFFALSLLTRGGGASTVKCCTWEDTRLARGAAEEAIINGGLVLIRVWSLQDPAVLSVLTASCVPWIFFPVRAAQP